MKNSYIIDHMNPIMVKWELIVIILAVYSSIVLPLDIAFKPPSLSDARIKFINYGIDFLFFIDIVISFRITSIDLMTGEAITIPKIIARNYL